MGRLVMTPHPAHRTVSSGSPQRSFCETDIFSSPPHKRQGSSVCLLCSRVICEQKMPARQSPCQYIAGRGRVIGERLFVIGGREEEVAISSHGSLGKRRKKLLLQRGAWAARLSSRRVGILPTSSTPVGRCGSAAPTYRRRRSCGQDARAPL